MIQKPNLTTRYFTKDTVLATWLYMNGLKLEEVTTEQSAQFIFSGNQSEINSLIEAFQEGNPHGNIITFFRSYKHLISKIKDR